MRGLALGLLLGIASAQNLLLIRDTAALVQLLDSAQAQIVLQVPMLRGDPELANALHRAIAVRGLVVYVLAQRQWAQQGDSYLPWLGLHRLGGKYPNLHLRLTEHPLEAFLLVDGRFVVTGRLGQPPNPLESIATVGVDDPARAQAYLRRFRARFAQAQPMVWPEPWPSR